MGQPIVVTEQPSDANRGVVRFVTSRMLTGTGHERYRSGDDIFGHRPPDVIARRLLPLDSVAGVHVHGNMITVELNRGYEADGVREVLEDLYVFYRDNLVNPEDDAGTELTAGYPERDDAVGDSDAAAETAGAASTD